MPSLFKAQDNSILSAPDAVYNWRVYALAISASMGSSMFGYDSAFIGGTLTLPSFENRFGLTSNPKQAAALSANIVSTFQAGCFFGAIFVSYLIEKFGRKFLLVACGILFDVGAILQLASSGSVGLIYGGRMLTGGVTHIVLLVNRNKFYANKMIQALRLGLLPLLSPNLSQNGLLLRFVADLLAFSK